MKFNSTMTRSAIRAVLSLAVMGLVAAVAPNAEAYHWRGAATCLKEIGEGKASNTNNSGIWALNCTASPVAGNWKVVLGAIYSTGNGENDNWNWNLDPQGGAGSHITVWNGQPYVVSAASDVWVKSGNTETGSGTWYAYPTNKCEGTGAIKIQQNVGSPAIAVGDNYNVWVVEGDGYPVNTVRHWNGTCWERLPTLATSVKEISIWGQPPSGQRYRPWVSTTDGNLYQLNAAYQWQVIPYGWGDGIGGYNEVIGLGSTTLWNFNFTTQVFSQGARETAWTGGAIKQIAKNDWLIAANGMGYHWE